VVVRPALLVLRPALDELPLREGVDGPLLDLRSDPVAGLAGVLDLLQEVALTVVDLDRRGACLLRRLRGGRLLGAGLRGRFLGGRLRGDAGLPRAAPLRPAGLGRCTRTLATGLLLHRHRSSPRTEGNLATRIDGLPGSLS